VAIAEAKVGKGQLFLFGPEVLFRGQPHGTAAKPPPPQVVSQQLLMTAEASAEYFS
jgi:hypothetical protein